MARFLHRLGGAAVRHRKLVLLVWVVAALGLFGISKASGGELSNQFRIPGAESQKALDLMVARMPPMAGTSAQVVFHAEHGTLDDAANKGEMERTITALGHLSHVEAVPSPATTGAISGDRTIAMTFVQYDVQAPQLPKGSYEHLTAVLDHAR